MTYPAGEILFHTRLKALSQFDSRNTSRGDWSILNSGMSDHYAVLRKGPELRAKISQSTLSISYSTVIELWQRYIDDGTSYTNLLAIEETVKAELDKYRIMGDTTGTIVQANIIAIGEYLEVARENMWIKVELIGEWNEETNITYAE